MSKKFVKSDMFKHNPPKETRVSPTYQPRKPSSYNEKADALDLRKYYEVLPAAASPQIKALIDKFPNFFCEASLGPESGAKGYLGKQDRVRETEPEHDEIVSWDSEGEIDLGVAVLNKNELRMYTNLAPLKVNELKRHERDFLEDELRRKSELEHHKESPQKPKEKPAMKEPVATQKQAPVKEVTSQSQSDDQIQIAKTTTYQSRPLQAQRHVPDERHEDILTMDEDDEFEDRFKDNESSSDDIFGERDDIDEKESEQSAPKQSHGSIHYAKGDFGMFALNQNQKADCEVWRLSDGANVSKKLSSIEMDRDYKTLHQQTYPYISFGTYPGFVDYETFQASPSVSIFMSGQRYSHPLGKPNSRKYSGGQYDQKPRVRKGSGIQYKPKKNEYV